MSSMTVAAIASGRPCSSRATVTVVSGSAKTARTPFTWACNSASVNPPEWWPST